MHCIVIVRYSVFTRQRPSAWLIGKGKPIDQYQQDLFANERLDSHQRLFFEVTVPSLLDRSPAPHRDWLRLIVVTSSELPRAYYDNLCAYLAPYDWAQVVTRTPDESPDLSREVPAVLEELAGAQRGPLVHATVRLDDDDALGRHYFADLSRYVQPQLSGYCVSFPLGYVAILDSAQEACQEYLEVYVAKNAQGLAHINTYDPITKSFTSNNKSVYELGNHMKIDQHTPVILDARHPAYLRTVHEGADTFRSLAERRAQLGGLRSVPREVVAQSIALSSSRFGAARSPRPAG